MKIQGPGSTIPSSKVKKKNNGSDSSGEDFGSIMQGGEKSPAGVSTTQSMANIDALLAAQSVEDPTEKSARQRAKHRSNTLLRELEKIRMAMLNGSLTVGHMIDMADIVASHRDKVSDPHLTGILDEIDLRAQVELAKMRVVLDKNSAKGASAS